MAIIICSDKCGKCGENFLKDPFNTGDYNEDGILMRWCPDCGQMLPKLHDFMIETRIGTNSKKLTSVRLAKIYRIDYREMNSLLKTLKYIESREEFAAILSERANLIFNISTKKEDVIRIIKRG